MKQKNDQLAFNVREAAAMLGISAPTMLKLLPRITHQRVGKRVLISRAALERFLESSEGEKAY